MDNFNGYQPVYYAQPNMYYQPTATTAVPNPRNWQQYYQPQQAVMPQQNQQSVPQMNTNIVWVQGISGAKSYNLPNNTTLPLWDSEAQVIYIKSVDANGKPSMTILDYTERDPEAGNTQPVNAEYVTKEQMETLNEQLASFSKKLDGMGNYVTKDQLDLLNIHINDLGDQIEDIENRIMSFGKPQNNNNNNVNKRGNK